jgi:protein TonB
MSQSDRFTPAGSTSRNMAVAGAVVAAHAAALWAMQHAFAQPQPPEVVVPAEVIAEFVAPPAPAPKPPAPPPPAPAPKPQPKPVVKKAALPKAIADPTPSPAAPRGAIDDAPQEKTPPAPPAPATPPVPPAPPAPPAAPKMELPSSNAAYLNNPSPTYPAVSKRMGEQGKVFLRVYINEQGQPEKIEIKQTSGYDRLDEAALNTVRNWKFVPGKRNGVPEAMWHIVPINFVLK